MKLARFILISILIEMVFSPSGAIRAQGPSISCSDIDPILVGESGAGGMLLHCAYSYGGDYSSWDGVEWALNNSSIPAGYTSHFAGGFFVQVGQYPEEYPYLCTHEEVYSPAPESELAMDMIICYFWN